MKIQLFKIVIFTRKSTACSARNNCQKIIHHPKNLKNLKKNIGTHLVCFNTDLVCCRVFYPSKIEAFSLVNLPDFLRLPIENNFATDQPYIG